MAQAEGYTYEEAHDVKPALHGKEWHYVAVIGPNRLELYATMLEVECGGDAERVSARGALPLDSNVEWEAG